MSKAKGNILRLMGQIEQDGEKIAGLKSDIAKRGEQLKEKNKKIREIEIQSAKSLDSTEKDKTESKRKIDNLLAKNSVIQARLDKAKKALKTERSIGNAGRRRQSKWTV